MSYTLLDLRTKTRRRLKDNSYSSSDIDYFLNDAQNEIADLFTWPFLEAVVDGALTIGEYTFEQQTNHQLTMGLIIKHPTTDNPFNLTNYYTPNKEFFQRFPAPETYTNAQPSSWTEYGNQIYFNCPVDLAYTLRQFYLKRPTELTTDAQVPDLPSDFAEALVLGATYRAEQQRDNYDFAAILENKFNDKVGDLIDRYASRQLITAEHTVLGRGLNTDPWSK